MTLSSLASGGLLYLEAIWLTLEPFVLGLLALVVLLLAIEWVTGKYDE